MRYLHRLRTRIILSFLLLGFGLTALFAVTTVYLRARLENQLIESWLLSEADNFVQFTTARYNQNPLVVQGPGAGPDVTAAGVFADLLRVAAYLGARV